jgi:phosphatidylglycerol lysyltransferase
MPRVVSGYRAVWDVATTTRRDTYTTGIAPYKNGACVKGTIRILAGAEARSLTREQRWELLSPYLLQHGRGCLAYSTLQDGLDYFIVEGMGYIASKTVGRICPTTIILGDPICRRGEWAAVLDEFFQHHADPFFAQVSEKMALELERRGFFVNECGIETLLDLPDWSVVGNKQKRLRYAVNVNANAGIAVGECAAAETNLAELRAISDTWRSSKVNHHVELDFLTRPAVYEPEPFVRVFGARSGERLIAFVSFDPLFEQGCVVGYVTQHSRYLPEVTKGTVRAVTLHAIEQFRSEGIQRVSLGWSPLFAIEDLDRHNSPFLTTVAVTLFQWGNRFYSFKNLAASKRQYHGEEKRVYLATRHKYPVREIYRLFRACGINPVKQLLTPKCS